MKEKILKIYRRPQKLPANQHQPCGQGGQYGRCRLAGNFQGRRQIFKNFSFLCQFSNILSDFVMLNFVAIRKGINTTPGTSGIYVPCGRKEVVQKWKNQKANFFSERELSFSEIGQLSSRAKRGQTVQIEEKESSRGKKRSLRVFSFQNVTSFRRTDAFFLAQTLDLKSDLTYLPPPEIWLPTKLDIQNS